MSKQLVIVTATEVLDGDTFKTQANESIRLQAVCAPERGQPGWELAKNRLSQLVLGRQVAVDTVAVDDYGRFVADVFVEGRFVNEIMRQYGYRCP